MVQSPSHCVSVFDWPGTRAPYSPCTMVSMCPMLKPPGARPLALSGLKPNNHWFFQTAFAKTCKAKVWVLNWTKTRYWMLEWFVLCSIAIFSMPFNKKKNWKNPCSVRLSSTFPNSNYHISIYIYHFLACFISFSGWSVSLFKVCASWLEHRYWKNVVLLHSGFKIGVICECCVSNMFRNLFWF